MDLREQLLILITTPLYLLVIGLELFISNYRHRNTYSRKDIITNIYLMLANGSIELVVRIFYIGLFVLLYEHRLFHFNNPIVYWVSLVLLEDLLYYWLHRIDHNVRFFWAVHVTHHSSEFMNFTVGFRSSVFQPLYRFLYFLPLAWMGFQPLDILFVFAATQIWGILVHTELIDKMGWLEAVFVTPSHHRVHHASNPRYLDKNMGMFLIIWDRMFGTFQAELPAEEYQQIRYGLTKQPEHLNAGNVIFHEWSGIAHDLKRTDIGFHEKWHYLFGPPGYSHDGSRMTSEEMRRQEEMRVAVRATNGREN